MHWRRLTEWAGRDKEVGESVGNESIRGAVGDSGGHLKWKHWKGLGKAEELMEFPK